MAASLGVTVIDAAPGNRLTIAGSGLTPGSGASVTLDSQGVLAPPGLTPSTSTLPSTFASDGTSVQITIPDGVMSGTLTVTAHDATTATCALRARSQYVQSSEYDGEGSNISSLPAGELDRILRRASAHVDAYLGDSLRLLQVLERPRYKNQREGAPRVYPYRTSGRKCPIVSVDQLAFVSAKNLVTVFNTDDMYINENGGYIEILAYAIGNYALLGELQMIGYSANVIEVAYTSGYGLAHYPSEVCEATALTATALLNRRQRQTMGLGPVAKFKDDVALDEDAFKMPADAKRLLRKFCTMTLA